MDINSESINVFKQYLSCRTDHPTPNYHSALQLLQLRARHFEFDIQCYSIVEDNPVLVISWIGSEPSLGSIAFYSHMDVVPANDADQWISDPFSLNCIVNDRFIARGAQDMKNVGIQHLEALGRLKQKGVTLKRTIHVIFAADEERGGYKGMGVFVDSEHFAKLNISCWIDEGLASGAGNQKIPIYYGERSPCWVLVHTRGATCHGSRTPEFNAPKQCLLLGSLLATQIPIIFPGSSCNVTYMNSVETKDQLNLVPATATIGFDIRIPPTAEASGLLKFIEESAGKYGAVVEYLQTPKANCPPSCIDSEFFRAIGSTVVSMGRDWSAEVFPASTDARFVRGKGIPAYGFSWMPNHPILLHEKNEYLEVGCFLEGITVFEVLMKNLGNL
ncbi:hypothetical protein RCL1_004105 [Eukaryota sp. TZLM3-RCL]